MDRRPTASRRAAEGGSQGHTVPGCGQGGSRCQQWGHSLQGKASRLLRKGGGQSGSSHGGRRGPRTPCEAQPGVATGGRRQRAAAGRARSDERAVLWLHLIQKRSSSWGSCLLHCTTDPYNKLFLREGTSIDLCSLQPGKASCARLSVWGPETWALRGARGLTPPAVGRHHTGQTQTGHAGGGSQGRISAEGFEDRHEHGRSRTLDPEGRPSREKGTPWAMACVGAARGRREACAPGTTRRGSALPTPVAPSYKHVTNQNKHVRTDDPWLSPPTSVLGTERPRSEDPKRPTEPGSMRGHHAFLR